MDRGAWQATVRRVPKTTEQLSTAQRQGAACDMSYTNTAPPLLLQKFLFEEIFKDLEQYQAVSGLA